MNPKIKNIIIFVGLGVALTAMYLLFVKKAPATPSLVSSSSATTASSALPAEDAKFAKEFLGILLNVKSIHLEDSIFNDEAFATLRDGTIILNPDGTEGRPNPFAPLGSDLSASSVVATPPTSTTIVPTAPVSTTPATTPASSGTATPGATTPPATGATPPATPVTPGGVKN